MQLGIFAKTFARGDFEQAFAAIKSHGLDCLQFNFSCAGLPTLPESIDPGLVRRIRSALERQSLTMAAVSGTGNLIHPDAKKRAKCLAGLHTVIRACPSLGAPITTLCTGSRDSTDMWRRHPENQSPEAWRDLLRSLEQILPVASESRVHLGVEPEPSNVINSAPRARKLLDEMHSPWLKVVFDAANLLQPQTMDRQDVVLAEAMDLLGPDIVLAHAKDLAADGSATHVAAGRGRVDYELYVTLLQKAGFDGPLVLHNLAEDEVSSSVAFLQQVLQHVRSS